MSILPGPESATTENENRKSPTASDAHDEVLDIRSSDYTASPVATGDLTHDGTPITPHVGAAEAAGRGDHRPVEALAHGQPVLRDHAARAEDAPQLEMVATLGQQGDRREARAAETRGGPRHAGEASRVRPARARPRPLLSPARGRRCRPAHRHSRVHGRAPRAPRARLLELGRDAEEQVLAPVGGAELNADREAVGAPVEGERDGRLPGDVEGHGEGDE